MGLVLGVEDTMWHQNTEYACIPCLDRGHLDACMRGDISVKALELLRPRQGPVPFCSLLRVSELASTECQKMTYTLQ